MTELHPLLVRQLRRLGLGLDAMPRTDDAWRALLGRLSAHYRDLDEERYLNERAFTISSREMEELYARLKSQSDHELARQRDELTRSLAMLHATLEAMTEGVLVTSATGQILAHNRKLLEMWDVGAESIATGLVQLGDAMGRRMLDPHKIPGAIAAYLRGQPPTRYTTHELADGRTIERYSSPVRGEDGETLAHLLLYRDITVQRQVQGELMQARDLAEQGSRAKSEFLANMSHELRTPLNAIIGFSRVLRESEPDAPTCDRYLGFIHASGEHMLRLVDDLLDLRRIEEARHHLELKPHAIAGLVGPAVDMVRMLVNSRQQELCVATPEPHVVARCDARAVIQVLVNLLTNAAKYTHEGGHLALEVGSEPEHVVLAVRDDGIGIAADDQPHLFTYFNQVGAKQRHHMRGTGVGLALSKGLVEAMGGTLTVESAPGRGSTFRFTLPLP